MMKRRTIIYFDPEALEILDRLRGLTPKSMYVNYQIKQLGKATTDQTKTHERMIEAPKTIPEKRSDISAPIEIPPTTLAHIKKKTNQDMIICPQCHEKNILTNRRTHNRRCSFCGFNIKNEMFEIVTMEINYNIEKVK